MMRDNGWETEDEFAVAAQHHLPPPTDTPYRTPAPSIRSNRSNRSRRSSRQKSVSPGPSSSPPPLPQGEKRMSCSLDVTNDETISILDPRRFTPTLHANLVAEILTLRRDQEEKIRTIESLEEALHDTRGEHESLQDRLADTSKESRALKRQLALLEGGTSSALSELAKERDEAVETTTEMRRRLETVQKKLKGRDEEVDRVQNLWANDKDNWMKRGESWKLKTVLDEVAAYEASRSRNQPQGHNPEDKDAGNESDGGSVRTMSLTSSIRFSMLNGPNGYGVTKGNGLSLADELDLDESETDYDGGRDSLMSSPEKHHRTQSRESILFRTHRRNQSGDSLKRPGSITRGKSLLNQTVLERLEGGISEDDEVAPKPTFQYVDTGIQYSPPPSPKLTSVIEIVTVIEPTALVEPEISHKFEEQPSVEVSSKDWEVGANQRRKRVYTNPPLVIEPPKISPTRAPPPPPPSQSMPIKEENKMTSTSTQTEAETETRDTSPTSPKRIPPPIPIPSIQLHPPSSAPATPRESLLPQFSKDAGCQVSISAPIATRSMAVQTEEIRVAQRLNTLPAHLHPSMISSNPPSPDLKPDGLQFSPFPDTLPPKNPRRQSSQRSITTLPSSPPIMETRDAYPGNNDDGPLAKDRGQIRRPHRISSLFAGFDGVSSDEVDEFDDGDVSDNDFRTALSAPNATKKDMKKISQVSRSVPQKTQISNVLTIKIPSNLDNEADDQFDEEILELPPRTSAKAARTLGHPLPITAMAKSAQMHRSALIQSGFGVSEEVAPPFPIPTRASSRRPGVAASAPSDGNRSPSHGRGSKPYRAGSVSRTGSIGRTGSVRKVRSAAAITRGRRPPRRSESRSPPMSPTIDPESPGLPPLPHNDITTPRFSRDNGSGGYRMHRQQLSTTNTTFTTNTAGSSVITDIQSTNQATTVVDAIAQTMVGEWMFKYVRRRKSFGVSDHDGDNATNGARHKRWVWLAPYERAVMWSSKQPTSGSALLGKTGRKLTIQSVLDVKDDNAPPRGSGGVFDRSILILTPARALKFTAISRERHYVWLTALSFLAHSSQAVPDVIAPHPAQTLSIKASPLPDFQKPGRMQKTHKIRDSIKVAKGKNAFNRTGPASNYSSSQQTDTNTSVHDNESFHTNSHSVRSDPAEAPFVPRFSDRGMGSHGRKRSNTGSHIPPPLSFRGFSAGHVPTNSTAGMSDRTTGSSENHSSYSQPSSATGYNGPSSRSSVRTSDASSRPGAVVNNFFDAVGTMRMEAFISPLGVTRFDDFPDEQDEMDMISLQRRHSRDGSRRNRNKESFGVSRGGFGGRAIEDWYSGSRTAGEEEYGHHELEERSERHGRDSREDPFSNF
ncbi:nuclear migration protein [Botrytis cinerea]